MEAAGPLKILSIRQSNAQEFPPDGRDVHNFGELSPLRRTSTFGNLLLLRTGLRWPPQSPRVVGRLPDRCCLRYGHWQAKRVAQRSASLHRACSERSAFGNSERIDSVPTAAQLALRPRKDGISITACSIELRTAEKRPCGLKPRGAAWRAGSETGFAVGASAGLLNCGRGSLRSICSALPRPS